MTHLCEPSEERPTALDVPWHHQKASRQANMLNINGQQQPAMFHITLSNTQQSLNDETK